MEIETMAETKSKIPSPPSAERGRGEGVVSPPAVPLTLRAFSHKGSPPVYGGSTAEGGEGGEATARPSPPPPRCARSPSPASQGRNQDDGIVAIARAWIGTPYVHQASLKGVGCDCLGLLRGVWRELRGEEPEELPPYSLDWAEATGAETLYMALARHCREVALPPFTGGGPPQAGRGAEPDALQPGDIAVFRMLPRGPAKHCGIVGGANLTSPNAGRSEDCDPALDAGLQSSGCGNVHFDPPPTRRVSRKLETLRPPRVGGGNLTLIHARQNKRVSEEPFSAFWRGKLAYAFRL